ncbi:MAG TPA: hypothetical protein P5323_02455 [Candidatus Moranbacteria bacterium]|nr:hypothetical protein [Candidatus Moranbacteria bacterium]HRY27974.1 hypothetical protein [Candidatus Moranbacteria bacterium]HSA08210.1 hypothetical protein [Candidatus Moranbacteria bacterium]
MLEVGEMEKGAANMVAKIRKSFFKWPLVFLFGLAGFSSLIACGWAINEGFKGLKQTFGLF